MLPSIQMAHNVNGKTQKAIARECGVTVQSFYYWSTGRSRCPKHKRQSVDRAFGVDVDWLQYDVEFSACERLSAPVKPVASKNAPASQETPRIAPAPAPAPSDMFLELYGDLLQ